MSTQNNEMLSMDDYNSRIFGIKMGNVSIEQDTEIHDGMSFVTRVIDEAILNSYKHISVKIETSQKRMVNCFLESKFTLADTLVTWVFNFDYSRLPELEHKVELADCSAKDLAQIMSIAKTSFKYDRYHSDDSLSDDLCDKYYEEWVKNSYNGFADRVIVARYENEAVGFTTAKIQQHSEYSQLVLSAVSNKYRGLGVYTSMIHEGVAWLKTNRAQCNKGLTVGTQIENIAVQKAWNKLGFSPYRSQHILQLSLINSDMKNR